MAHIPRSVNLQWSDFGEAEESSRGVLQSDRFAIARRLARLGVSPDQHIVVAGDGLSGRGEEGRLAWMLLVLGCKNVQFSSLQALGAKQTNMESPVPRMAPIWKPEENLALEASREEILHVINKSGVYKATRWRADSPERVYRIIDVRSEKAYLGSQMESNIKAVPNIDAINIPWREFFTKNFRPNPGIRSRLEAVGIRPGFRILVISEDGVESGAVTAALLAIGYPDVANVSGGLKQLLARPR